MSEGLYSEARGVRGDVDPSMLNPLRVAGMEGLGGPASFTASLRGPAHAIMGSSARVPRTFRGPLFPERTRLALPRPPARCSHWQERSPRPQGLAPPAPQRGREDSTSGRGAGGLREEGAGASPRAGVQARGRLAAQPLLPGRAGGGGAAVTRTASASWAGCRALGEACAPQAEGAAQVAAEAGRGWRRHPVGTPALAPRTCRHSGSAP